MQDNSTIIALRDYLNKSGFVATRLPHGSRTTPDLFAEDEGGGERYVIEVKQRHHPPKEWKSLKRRNVISGQVAKAAEQLAAYDEGDPLRVMWFLGQPPEQEWYYKQLWMSVYGLLVVTGLGAERGVVKNCYYAGESDFWRLRDSLDGVLLGTVGGVLVNDLSPRADRFKASRLCKCWGAPVCDPRDDERSGEVFVIRDDSVDRRDKGAVQSHLGRKYGLQNVHLETLFRVTAWV